MKIRELYGIIEKNGDKLYCYNAERDDINETSDPETISKNISDISRVRRVLDIVSRYLPVKLSPMSYQKVSIYTNNENVCLQYPSCWDVEDVIDVIQHLDELLDSWCLRRTNLESEIRPDDARKIRELFGETETELDRLLAE